MDGPWPEPGACFLAVTVTEVNKSAFDNVAYRFSPPFPYDNDTGALLTHARLNVLIPIGDKAST
jgi:hypothetical protein